jgi:hypothetical protein
MSIYKRRLKADELNKEGGYKNKVYFAPVADFLSLKKPVGPFAAPGDKFKITTAHTFTAPAGFIAFDCKKHAVTTTAETTGEDGSKSLTYKCRFTLLGDDAITQEYLETMLNDDIIMLVKDQDCLVATEHVQFGDECVTPDFTITFDGKTTKEGLKEWTVEATVKAKRFFYTGAVTEKVVA